MYFASTETHYFYKATLYQYYKWKRKKKYHLFQIESNHKTNTTQSQVIKILPPLPADIETETSILLLKMEIVSIRKMFKTP